MQKAYVRINWENFPSEETALNETNLNRMDAAIDEIDNRVITLDTIKLSVAEASGLIASWDIDDETGVITIVHKDGTTETKNTNINKIAVNVHYDRATQALVLEYPDGTSDSVSLSDFITNTEFINSPTIAISANNEGVVSAQVRENSIGDAHLRTNYLADIRVSEANALASQAEAEANAINSRSWAVGDTQSRQGEAENNAKYYCETAAGEALLATEAKADAQDLVDAAIARLTGLRVWVDFEDGNLYYEAESGVALRVDETTGNLMYEVLTI